jgi:hypothetical protein
MKETMLRLRPKSMSSLTLSQIPFPLFLQRPTLIIKLKPFLQPRLRTRTLSVSSSFSTAVSRSSNCFHDDNLSCSMPNTKPFRVAVLLSGGVDSSVALRLLHAAGHSCTAFYLKIWFQVRLFIFI